jgi:hypothetical protein
MINKNGTENNEVARGEASSLDSRYGAIGISAVAAALQFKSSAKNPAYAPVVPQLDRWLADMADMAA